MCQHKTSVYQNVPQLCSRAFRRSNLIIRANKSSRYPTEFSLMRSRFMRTSKSFSPLSICSFVHSHPMSDLERNFIFSRSSEVSPLLTDISILYNSLTLLTGSSFPLFASDVCGLGADMN